MKIAVYLHLATMNHWREIAAELAGRIEGSGLYDEAHSLTACLVGDGSIGADILEEKWSVVSTGQGVDAFEYPTLERLWSDCQEDPDRLVLYLHSKGASYRGKRPQRDRWRRYMSYFTITRWRECIDILLQGVEVVGTERTCHENRLEDFFAGNFWWARGDYVQSLPRPEANTRRAHPRFWAEMWVLSNGAENFNWHVVNPTSRAWGTFQIKESMYRGVRCPEVCRDDR